MSFFLVYFESKNVASTNYQGFADVGNFNLPEGLYAGQIGLAIEDKQYAGQIVSDRSRQSVNDMFLKKGEALKQELFDFVANRLRNDCIVANVVGYIERGGEERLAVKDLKKMNLQQWMDLFDRDLFRDGSGVRIVK